LFTNFDYIATVDEAINAVVRETTYLRIDLGAIYLVVVG